VRDRTLRRDEGFSLVETLVGLAILLVVAAGVLPLSLIAFRISENHGHLSARAAEYAHDKLEQLISMSYGDTVTDTRTFPATTTGGTGLAVGGSSNPDAPVAGYVDYLSQTGALLASAGITPPANWYYQRVWAVEQVGAADTACPLVVSPQQICLKRITVTARIRFAAQGGVTPPRVTIAALKTYPF
jgi:prepilin-type N-terminal cleavage/methylation domain-containing protein